MYSHDTYGLGHIRRTMAIAEHLKGPNVNILILTGSPIVGRFSFSEQIDFVRIPGMIKKTNEEYLPLSIRIHPAHAVDIRKSIITATAKAFQPDLFIVDKEPLGLKKEVLPTLEWFRRCLPKTRTILGLRDIMDEATTVVLDWKKKGVYSVLDRLYSEIWIYGNREIYDPVVEYDISEAIGQKMVYTGYIPRKVPGPEIARKLRKKFGVREKEKVVLVTTGGGGDGYPVIDTYLTMIERLACGAPIRSLIVTGPFMPLEERDDVHARAKRLGIRCWDFYARMENLIAVSDLVVCMGGYNTICEILSQKTVALVVPREVPRKEQLIRAMALKNRHLVDYIPWSQMTPAIMHEKITDLLCFPERYHNAIQDFSLTGLCIMRDRLALFQQSSP
ncbi:MAG: glycosyltransferase [Thermodesulfobacteriota bacterium]